MVKSRYQKTFQSAALIEGWEPLIIESVDGFDEGGEHISVVSRYEPLVVPDDPWVAMPYEGQNLVSCCLWQPPINVRYNFRCVISEEGYVNIYGPGGEPDATYQIEDAGVWRKGAPGYGYLSRIRAIGRGLYVCGDARQVYRLVFPSNAADAEQLLRRARFMALDQEIRQAPTPPMPDGRDEAAFDAWLDTTDTCQFNDIGGTSESDIYAVGDEAWHFDGTTWRQLALPNDGERLHVVHAIDARRVVLAGANGYVLVGNATEGFANLSSVDDNQTFTGAAWFDGRLWLAASTGLFALDPATRRIVPVATGLVPELQDAHLLEAKDGVLWSFGFKDLAYLDTRAAAGAEGRPAAWARIHHPDNSRIGDPVAATAERRPPEEADAETRPVPAWLRAAATAPASVAEPWSSAQGPVMRAIALVGRYVGKQFAASLRPLGIREADLLRPQTSRYEVMLPRHGVTLVLQHTAVPDTLVLKHGMPAGGAWGLAEVRLLAPAGAAQKQGAAWRGVWPANLDPAAEADDVLHQAIDTWGEDYTEAGRQVSFFTDGPEGAAWVVNLEWMPKEQRLRQLRVLHMGSYLP
ncbi:hypothetical protein ACFX58_10905 [Sphingomonas sp. NCPPB 2930]